MCKVTLQPLIGASSTQRVQLQPLMQIMNLGIILFCRTYTWSCQYTQGGESISLRFKFNLFVTSVILPHAPRLFDDSLGQSLLHFSCFLDCLLHIINPQVQMNTGDSGSTLLVTSSFGMSVWFPDGRSVCLFSLFLLATTIITPFLN